MIRVSLKAVLLATALLAACGTNLPEQGDSATPTTAQDIEAELAASGVDCADTPTTYDMSRCGSWAIALEEERLARFIELAEARLGEGEMRGRTLFRESQAAWMLYRDAECEAVGEGLAGGSIMGVAIGWCRLALTRERAHTIWTNHLQYFDSTPPPAPEPVETVLEERLGNRAD